MHIYLYNVTSFLLKSSEWYYNVDKNFGIHILHSVWHPLKPQYQLLIYAGNILHCASLFVKISREESTADWSFF